MRRPSEASRAQILDGWVGWVRVGFQHLAGDADFHRASHRGVIRTARGRCSLPSTARPESWRISLLSCTARCLFRSKISPHSCSFEKLQSHSRSSCVRCERCAHPLDPRLMSMRPMPMQRRMEGGYGQAMTMRQGQGQGMQGMGQGMQVCDLCYWGD